MAGGRNTRSPLIALTALLLAACGSGTSGGGEAAGGSYQPPSKMVFLSGFEPGGTIDLAINTVMETVKEAGADTNPRIDHLPGGSGLVGIASLSADHKGADDILMVTARASLLASIQQGEKSNATLFDLIPVARLFSEYSLMYVPTASPYKSIDDVVADLKTKPKDVTLGGGSLSGASAISVAQLATAIGTEFGALTYIPYEPTEYAQAILGGQVDVFLGGADLFNLVESGDIRPLAISSEQRLASLPDVPTYTEQGYDVVNINWMGVFAPPDAPAEAVAYWSEVIGRATQTQKFTDTAADNGWDVQYLPHDEFAAYTKSIVGQMTDVLRDLKLLDG